jgi:3'-phosphoadenosine 5'-phosphosulfate sulfotransferase (PAPS reductase)/FAD synthetase
MNYPLDLKIRMAKARIRAAISKYGENNCYVSFSGGKDSTVLSHLVLSMGYNLDHVYSNTRLEYPECVKFSNSWCKKHKVKLITVLPEVIPTELWSKYGYPMFSKDAAEILERIRLGHKVNPKKIKKVQHLLKYKNVKVSSKCCYFLKKKPLKEWQKRSGKRVAIMGVRAEESQMRRTVWVRKGCIYETKDQVVCNPIVFFTDKDIYDYAKKYKLKFAEIYYKGMKRNGCYCCGFGCHLAGENNFVKLYKYNPTLWQTVMDKWGYRDICKKCDVQIK